MRDKRLLTEELISLLPEDQRTGVASTMHAWWFNIRRNGGMRLTAIGYHAFVNDLELENYAYDIDNPLLFTQHTILKLDRKFATITAPSATSSPCFDAQA